MILWSLAALTLVAARWIDPPTTAVHVERRLQAWIHRQPYRERYKFVPLSQISPHLEHAVVSAEDARFYQHHGFDWHAIQLAAEEDMEGDRTRGGSTLDQQLVKNLFFGTGRSILRKGAETTLVRGGGLPFLLRRRRARHRPAAVGAAGRDFAGSLEAAARAHEQIQHGDPEADAPGGLVRPCGGAGRREKQVLRLRCAPLRMTAVRMGQAFGSAHNDRSWD